MIAIVCGLATRSRAYSKASMAELAASNKNQR
jgi:hypothetical protein